MVTVAALAFFVVLGPVQVCAHHPWLALLVASVLGACIRFERAGDGRWRWLAVASIAWAAFGLREWIAPGGPANWDVLRLDLVAIALVLWVVTAVALLRAGRALSPPWPVALRVLAVLLIVSTLLGTGLGALVLGREELYPWTDWSAPHAVLHIVNESDRDVAVEWRWADDPDWWHRLDTSRREPRGVPSGSERLCQLGPLILTKHWHEAVPADGFEPPAGYTKDVVLRLDTRGFGAAEHTFTAALNGHALVRVTSDHRVLFATGGETSLGAPSYGPAKQLTLR
jgi:hypothetical protein